MDRLRCNTKLIGVHEAKPHAQGVPSCQRSVSSALLLMTFSRWVDARKWRLPLWPNLYVE